MEAAVEKSCSLWFLEHRSVASLSFQMLTPFQPSQPTHLRDGDLGKEFAKLCDNLPWEKLNMISLNRCIF